MGASYANSSGRRRTGASSFYTLVVLTLYLAAIIPILVTRPRQRPQKRDNGSISRLLRRLFRSIQAGAHRRRRRVGRRVLRLRPLRHPPDPVDGQRDRRQEGLPLAVADRTPGQGRRRRDVPQDPERARGIGGRRRGAPELPGLRPPRRARGRPSRASRCRTASRRRPLVCTC